MGRKKKAADLAFPFAPVPIADFVLYHEQAIRQAVKDARAEISLLGASNIEGNKGRGRVSDKTARAAVQNVSSLPCVVLETGETVKAPEMWLLVLDEVRKAAGRCYCPNLIFDIWAACYGEAPCLMDARAVDAWRNIQNWIRFHVLETGREKGVVSFSDADIHSSIAAAG